MKYVKRCVCKGRLMGVQKAGLAALGQAITSSSVVAEAVSAISKTSNMWVLGWDGIES
jgi:hypothetical protein